MRFSLRADVFRYFVANAGRAEHFAPSGRYAEQIYVQFRQAQYP
jgi:hypothetical protein